MPVNILPTDAVLVKLFHLGVPDKKIADDYGVTVQAVNKRMVKLGLHRKPVSRQVNEYLAHRWKVRTTTDRDSHHMRYSAKMLRVWLRRQLGDQTLSVNQLKKADEWERRLRRDGVVLCYDPDTVDGWYYRHRHKKDGRLVIDWPEDLPFPDERFRKALELPQESAKESV